ncbi:dihydrofolate reductase family protein [Actinomadura graeca]|uniref:Dihydrofolate reductase family protein n=1 Tax=Actinomadura graeca TaxID=2750812 RepID=A0ABX8QY74_9ACTN|nr:dihydrofolate reductase family protein [Actinomadura graeca]QXJ23291.1 dihydrofolate reductase family protein [Actinomadura graeca]
MTKVISSASMSLDGFIAGPSESGFEYLFAWHRNGDVNVPSADPRWSFQVTETSADHIREQLATFGALVVGRRLFDVTRGWGGNHPCGVPIFVVTHRAPVDWPHPDAPFTFVTDGLESAVRQAKAVAGERHVGVAAGDMARQALDAGLLDELQIDLVPVLLGSGTRLLGDLAHAPVTLSGPTVAESIGVTHLRYQVNR